MARVGRVAVKALIYFEVLTGVGMNIDLSTVNTAVIDPYVKQTGAHRRRPFYSTSFQRPSWAPSPRMLFISILSCRRDRPAAGRYHRRGGENGVSHRQLLLGFYLTCLIFGVLWGWRAGSASA
jgi:hypothetical protein